MATRDFEVRMISELRPELLVSVQNGRIFMHLFRRRLATLGLVTLIVLSNAPAMAEPTAASEASAHILQAEIALQGNEYRKAASEYRKAAEKSRDPEVARKATLVGMTYGFDREAIRAAERWLKLDRDNDEARAILGQLHFRLGELREARRYYADLIAKDRDTAGEKLMLLVRYLSDEGDPQDADKLMRALAKPYRDSALAHFAVATMAMRAGETEHAIEAASRAVELDPSNLRAKLLYARALLVHGETDKAIEYTARIIGDDPDPDPDARMELAIMYMMTDRDDDALSQVNQVLLEQPARTDALRLMAIINFRQGHLDAAWDDFNDLLRTGEHRMDALYYLARICDYRGEYERAVRYYSEVTFGSNALIAQRRASALIAHEIGDVEAAILHLDRFAESSPEFAVDMTVAKAQLLASLDEYDESLAFYDKALGFRPDDESIVLGRAEILLKMGRVDDAIASYDDAVKRWPKSAMTLNAYGYTLADRTDRYEDAEQLIRKALKYDPESPAIIDSMGWVLYKLGRHEEALVELQRALSMLDDPEVAAHVVEVLAVMGRRDEALDVLVDAEEKTPDSPLLQNVRERFFKD